MFIRKPDNLKRSENTLLDKYLTNIAHSLDILNMVVEIAKKKGTGTDYYRNLTRYDVSEEAWKF